MTTPVRIGMIDTGVNAAHPHVGNIAGGVTIGSEGEMPGYEDQLGHAPLSPPCSTSKLPKRNSSP